MPTKTRAATGNTAGRPAQISDRGSRYYDLGGGVRLLSVTSALGLAIAKPALPAWAARTVAETAVEQLPRLVRYTADGRTDEAVKWLKGRPYAERDAAAAAGTKAHEAAEAHILGKPYTPPDPDSDLGRTLAQYLAFIDDWTPEYEATEAVVANVTAGYAGTLDALTRIPQLFGGGLCVLDYKTSRTGPYPEWALQVAAYARAEFLWLPSGDRVPMPAVDHAAVLRLRPGFYALHPVTVDIDRAYRVFLAALEVARWAADTDDRADAPVTVWAPAVRSTAPAREGELCPS